MPVVKLSPMFYREQLRAGRLAQGGNKGTDM